ncbi:hypothetical protein ASPWEDRAFT_34275 [Aspergillus wentii DTO 134E9]|uniref:DUF1772 domain-containing protein n=1 Tax=Aspergillus wentii DTO 134E9 TaxID=1073089 RepID=A0A1L9S0W0_ASPWE|nr:uncharacterized protein ASPWEDRAFT_34275 [Aspergillus wentii DTO 134E9]KAI9931198.1 hypothetical protein MW887_010859 [Aspergillus wentii]OJJ40794.1 hypothetical protein ASPWEDRAFT_34275 [Aspergillus wentii DTO 134E9]
MSATSAQATAIVAGSFLSGAMMSLSLLAVPVLLDSTTEASQLFFQWTRMYHYGHQALPTMAVGTFLLYSYTCIKRRSEKKSWTVFALAASMTLSMLPFTWLCMEPTNSELFRLEEVSRDGVVEMGMSGARALVVKWSLLHFVRSLFPLGGAVLGGCGDYLGEDAGRW